MVPYSHEPICSHAGPTARSKGDIAQRAQFASAIARAELGRYDRDARRNLAPRRKERPSHYLRMQSPTMPFPPTHRAVVPVRVAALTPPLQMAETSTSFASQVKASPVVSKARRAAPGPGVPGGPAEPGSPRGPGGPGGPGNPARPRSPVMPAGPGGPAGPASPRSPAMPAGPGGPASPRSPGAPAGPRSPAIPAGPGGPASPRSPCIPPGPAGPI